MFIFFTFIISLYIRIGPQHIIEKKKKEKKTMRANQTYLIDVKYIN